MITKVIKVAAMCGTNTAGKDINNNNTTLTMTTTMTMTSTASGTTNAGDDCRRLKLQSVGCIFKKRERWKELNEFKKKAKLRKLKLYRTFSYFITIDI